MTQSQDAPKGPDLVAGVPSADVPEGGKLVGLVGDDEVLVARVGGALFAIGAHCTHYGGPLGEGLIVGDTVRCPWHHAHFCLKSGEALAAPAIDPVRRWMVKEKDGVIRVGHEVATAPARRVRSAGAAPRRVVIIGGGAAGFACTEMLRREGFDGDLTILSADADAPYDRPNCSKDYLAGEAQPEWMPLRPDSWYGDHDVELELNVEVERLDFVGKTVSLEGGRTLTWDACLIATGAEPVRLPIEGFARPEVHVLRTLRDADAIAAAAKDARRVAVVGASFIGLEAAASLRHRGLEVHVVAPETVPLGRVMGDDIGRWVQGLHEKAGIIFHLGCTVKGWADGRLALEGGKTIAADFLVVGAGVRPRTQIAEAAGLACDRGILVDARLGTGTPGVYAAGDVARFPDHRSRDNVRIEHWIHAERQGQHVARMILGDDAPFADTPFFWSAHQDATIRYVGHAEKFDPPAVEGSLERRDAEVRFTSAGRLMALATIGRDVRSLNAGVAFERRR
ncbi:MAG TPA: FAD-dependent oxidoreductase [Rhizomicrobium sp.]|nr:FAD-dependent oxidoreductase [Rhizomicrobium sp.]